MEEQDRNVKKNEKEKKKWREDTHWEEGKEEER